MKLEVSDPDTYFQQDLQRCLQTEMQTLLISTVY